VLLLHGWDPQRPGDPYWFTIGGAAERGETLPEAAARELREETGIMVAPAGIGEPIDSSDIEFTWAGTRFDQRQTFYAIAVEADVAVSFAGQDWLERSSTDKHGWLHPEDLEGGPERPADPGLPRVMRLAIARVRGAA
jgi:8-oxo-dGTP pyrophosphatase MutT (NUDIX family)